MGHSRAHWDIFDLTGLIRIVFSMLAILATSAPAQTTTQPAVPKGEIAKYSFANSRVFPGTVRDYWVYVPRQYDPAKPACLIVNQDNIQFKSPPVFDRLIAAGKMPVTIAVFVAPGRVKAPTTQALDRFNRSFEFDTLSDDYARFLLDELLPDVETKTTSDGRPIRFSSLANDRAIMGSSSGAICAFTVAWDRPDSFSRVFTAIGTFVDLRGGNVYPSLIRKFEPRPIRIFLQDGSADHNSYGGDWWMANQEMKRALTFAGYEVNHTWGTGDHDHVQSTAIFADVMTWLWNDWPTPVKTGLGSEQLQQILIPGEGWQELSGEYGSAEDPCCDEKGQVLFVDVPNKKTFRIDANGTVSDAGLKPGVESGEAYAPGGHLFHGPPGGQIVASASGIFFTLPPSTDGPSLLGCIYPGTSSRTVDRGLRYYGGVTLSPDQTLLYANDRMSHWVFSFQIQKDGSLKYKQRFYDLFVPDADDDADAGQMCTDRDGRLYVATNSGIQICDQAGRVVAILPTPNGQITGLCFGGAEFDRLYATCGDRVYVRKLKAKGTLPFEAPIKPAPPKL